MPLSREMLEFRYSSVSMLVRKVDRPGRLETLRLNSFKFKLYGTVRKFSITVIEVVIDWPVKIIFL